MAFTQSSIGLTDPDTFGLLVQCREKMDELSAELLTHYSQFVVSLLNTTQLKNLLFTGLNAIRNQVQYTQFLEMKSTLNQLIDNEKKAKKKDKSTDTNTTTSTPIIVPKDASLTQTIPFDIISNAICPCLKMSSITKLARCDRKLAIICHTPTSIKNLMHRYDPYFYLPFEFYNRTLIDGHYPNIEQWDLHRFENVEQLSIEVHNDLKPAVFNAFRKVTRLSLYGVYTTVDKFNIMPLLQNISFVNARVLSPKLWISNQIRQIAFIDCSFTMSFIDSPVHQDMIHFVLPPQPNQIRILKFENSFWRKEDESQEDGIAVGIDHIKSSLCHLQGLVYHDHVLRETLNFFYHLVRNVLSNLVFFKNLESIHTHDYDADTDTPFYSCYLSDSNANPLPALRNITELCLSISMEQDPTSPLRSLHTLIPKLEKLCLVIQIQENDDQNVQNLKKTLQTILIKQTKLKTLQIVMVMDEIEDEDDETDGTFCSKRIAVVTELMKCMVTLLQFIRIQYNITPSKQPLLFRVHVKSCHHAGHPKCNLYGYMPVLRAFFAEVHNMIANYLITYPLGKIQFKISVNADYHQMRTAFKTHMKGLDVLFRVFFKKHGKILPLDNQPRYCCNDTDCMQWAISAMTNRVSQQDIYHERKWKVDCRYCCNTPWV
eukprot:183362_1